MADEKHDDPMAAAVRAAVGASLRFQAAAARTQAATLEGIANEYARVADDIEEGRVPLPTGGVRMRLVTDEFVGEGLPGDELPAEPLVQPLVVREFGNSPVFVADGEEDLSPAMHEFIEAFDERFRLSPHFVAAVNEAAGSEMAINVHTVEVVGDRIRELEAKAERRGANDGR